MLYLNGSPVEVTMFPDGTSQVWKLPEQFLNQTDYAYITWKFDHEGEIIQLAQLKDLLDTYLFRTDLTINYLPYGRQDKLVGNNTTFALTTFSWLLNAMEFDNIIIVDPHSSIALELIHNSRAVYPIEELDKVMGMTKSLLLCYPDKGAVSKYQSIYYNHYFISGEKVRDQLTGNIISYKLNGNCKGKRVLIVDDICDGGATFKLLSKELYDAGATEVNLFVTHGIFSKGLKTLKESGIKRIFTQDGEVGEYQNNITYRRL